MSRCSLLAVHVHFYSPSPFGGIIALSALLFPRTASPFRKAVVNRTKPPYGLHLPPSICGAPPYANLAEISGGA
ncbi:uncharacterized protein K444DRAFT_212621 [Hyaloscypha bicolor E]|uniref:Uncharacterized protein n=1 Tax=Hyaloscypha bicolor E TaxID=1095630 RepID=A0A2J6TPY1_9HELO|nr:uncharacterized protein K444DRAFT_212621 [Hyaloscypha bicolor E]PMD65069.1 hypothetical protein K444DRAFT_212621 [Hyaloscypha bicolor E]